MSLQTRCTMSLLAVVLLSHYAMPVAADNYAFLVAVQDYDVKQLKRLQYSRNDILEFHKTLLASGYDKGNIVLMHDDLKLLKQRRFIPEAKKIRQELKLLLSTLEASDSIIVAFAGHGVQFKGEKENYFCPADTDLGDKTRKSLIALSEIYQSLEKTKARKRLLLVDACRNDPQSQLGRSLSSAKLASVTRPQLTPPPKGVVALFSCSEGQQAYEWPDLKHGVFFYHVLQAWNQPSEALSLDQLVATTKTGTKKFARLKLGTLQSPEQKGFFSGEWILRKRLAAQLLTNSIGMRLKLIPAGEFLMGTSLADVAAALESDPKLKAEYLKDEQPQHKVRLTESFYMGAYEVTQADYEAIMGTNPSYFAATGSYKDRVAGKDTRQFPVEYVTWYDAVEFCNKLSSKERLTPCYRLASVEREDGRIKKATVSLLKGMGYRLPTEAEWEYACRAGTQTPFSFGSVLNGKQANVNGNYPYGTATKGPYLERTERVGQYGENAFGLFDMHGNVYEWCQDVFDSKAYESRSGITQNPLRLPGLFSTSGSESRVLRGGSWYNFGWDARSADRSRITPVYRDNNVGFRVVLSVGARTRNP